jgi:hypothetical protein
MTRKRTTENDVVVSGGAAAAPRRKAARPRSTHSTAAAETTPAPVETVATAPAPTTSSVTADKSEPGHAEIAQLAYSYWEARGCQGGSPEEDWLRAEVEIRRVSAASV